MKTLILTDNAFALKTALEVKKRYGNIDIRQSPEGTLPNVPLMNVKQDSEMITKEYSRVLSLHCKQFFPKDLVSRIRCVNVHPGYNPYNRGWFPHVFSILNGMKAGVTIHEMDEQLDHGRIIVQKEYMLTAWDTSESAYNSILLLERELLLEWYERIRDGNYTTYEPTEEGNVNYKRDYEKLKQIDMNKTGSFGEFLNLLRALSHGSFRNAYFYDFEGNRIYVHAKLTMDDTQRNTPSGS